MATIFWELPQVGWAGVHNAPGLAFALDSSGCISRRKLSCLLWNGLVAPRDNLSLEALRDIKASVRGQACPRAVAAHVLLPGVLESP